MYHHPKSPPFTPSTTAATTLSKDNSKCTPYIILASFFFSLLFILSLLSTSASQSLLTIRRDPSLFPNRPVSLTKIPYGPTPPSIAYLISGSAGDSARILRLLLATYHPRNHYLLHLDLSAPQTERDRLAVTIHSVPIFRAAQNVDVIGKANYAYQRGSSTVTSALHGASILLRLSSKWDWFISLSAGDYPLVTQDDLLHILSYLPKNLNFVNHSSYIGWKESKRLKPIIVDTGHYLLEKDEIFYVTQKRVLPNSFRLFSGSAFAMLTRSFIEFCILGTDNFPRTLLMYLANMPYSFTNYFPTILCNSKFKSTVINHNLQYVAFNMSSSKKKLSSRDLAEFNAMIQTGDAFATQFKFDDPVLDRIDRKILKRKPGRVVQGGWCLGIPANDTCSVWGDADILRPGKGAKRLERRIVKLLSGDRFRSQQCLDR
ncbi:hypothetical protein E1A91_D10G165200v1 [Gossypium mustelinum]|uniref:Beta-glucuronosyltransferase GlcAT14A n=4 Tax=Gossypium TaxID=3633 RepID=A0A5J5PRU0_GOSBA|nr:hypothetical protein ES319_D10G161300v1 [Gossypium barbadense]TYG50399.1 hypothetical protein ES288_D10G172300v1 [Gossypium darwinii]TYH49998.1 hypothetical protein ES332_D10G174800v1 [Gossypium tomentosum]TYI61331.1 hypothetical protein E1A91_D10G165200v1 [Gossypium mustelinum]